MAEMEDKWAQKEIAQEFGGNYDPETDDWNKDAFKANCNGFYYDFQLDDPSMILSLHPSSYFEGGKWKPYTEGYKRFNPPSKDDKIDFCYSKYPIARCIMTEDPTFTISNAFTDWNGGNPIESLFNSVKPYGPILGAISNGLSEALHEDKTNWGGSMNNFFKKGAEKLAAGLKVAERVSNKALFVQGTRFTYYNGTSFSTGNLELKFTRFSDYCKNKSGNWEFMPVNEYISNVLSPYCYGIYKGADTGGMFQDLSETYGKTIDDKIKEYVGFQTAPGGFQMSTKSLDNSLFGTLRLNIGGVYAVENLLIKNISFSFSKAQAKHPEKPGETVPLYADIVLSLAPASMVTDVSFKKILSGAGLENLRTKMASNFKDVLDDLKGKRSEQFKTVEELKNY